MAPSSRTTPPTLLSIWHTVPEDVQAIPPILDSINAWVQPQTVDAAVYNDLQGVLRSFQAFLPWTFRAMDGAAARGRIDIVQRLFTTGSEGCSADAFVGAAANGHLAVLRWLIRHFPGLYNRARFLVAAAEHNHVDVEKWTRGVFTPRDVVAPATEAAASNGFVGVLTALKPWPIRLTEAFTAAAAHEQHHVLEIGISNKRSEVEIKFSCTREESDVDTTWSSVMVLNRLHQVQRPAHPGDP